MSKILSFGFWNSVARLILRNRIIIIASIIGVTIFLATQWQHMRFSFTEANLLPDNHPINLVYEDFLDKFGEEGNMITIAVKDPLLFNPENLTAWNSLARSLEKYPEVENVISTGNLKKLKKFEDPNRFDMVPVLETQSPDVEEIEAFKEELFTGLPFYENLVYSKNSQTVQTVIYLNKDILNSQKRKDFVIDELQPVVQAFENETGMELYVSGMPYIRTLNAQNIVDEIELFIAGALLVTSLIFFFFFRSVRATVISMVTVLIGVMWSFGIIGLFKFEITILTALIPPLIIVIGIPNCIFLINVSST